MAKPLKRSEKAIQNETLMAITAEPDVMFWREHSAKAWVGQVVRTRPNQMLRIEAGMVVLQHAQPIIAGVPGIPDVMGVQKLTCGCGNVYGQATGFEIKTPEGSQEMTQRNFQRVFEQRGGRYEIVRDPQDAIDFLRASVR